MSIEHYYANESMDGCEGLLAIIVRANYAREGVQFVTPPELPQQVAFISHPKGHQVPAHGHYLQKREVYQTQEVLFIKTGRALLLVYSSARQLVARVTLEVGDVAVLVSGGHALQVLEDLTMFEVKQGPYSPTHDKFHY